jgi:flagellar biosynthesis protein FliQ
MVSSFITTITNEGLLLVLIVSGPPVVLSLMVGLAIALFQAITQIQEQSLTFVPKVIVVFGVLAILGPWLGSALAEFARLCFEGFATVVGR